MMLLSGNIPAHVVRELVGHAYLSITQGDAAIFSSDQASAVGVLDCAPRHGSGFVERSNRSAFERFPA
jgi:hypothetical protein